MDRGRRGAPRNRVIGAAPPPGPNRVTAARGAAPCGHRVWGGTAAGWGLGGMGGTSRAGGTLTVTYPVCVCAHPDTHTHTHTHPGTRTAPALQAAPADQAAMGAPTGSVGHRSSTPLTDVPDATRALLALYRGTPPGPARWTPPCRGAAVGARLWAGRRSEPLCVPHPVSRFGVRGTSTLFPAAGTDVSHRRAPGSPLRVCCAPSPLPGPALSPCPAASRPHDPGSYGAYGAEEGGGGGFVVAGPQRTPSSNSRCVLRDMGWAGAEPSCGAECGARRAQARGCAGPPRRGSSMGTRRRWAHGGAARGSPV